MKMKLFEQVPFESTDKFIFESENFQSENKAHAFYIEVKKTGINELTFNTIFCTEDGEKVACLNIYRHPQIMSVYDDLSIAAENGLDSFINALKKVDIGDRKLRIHTQLYVESIEEAINNLKTNPTALNNNIAL